jgi:hypothetical protein
MDKQMPATPSSSPQVAPGLGKVQDKIMRSVVVVCVLLASACAARDARPEHSGKVEAQAGESSTVRPRYREMTWPEYYTDVMDRAWRNGATVVWVSPPQVRKGKPKAAPEGR